MLKLSEHARFIDDTRTISVDASHQHTASVIIVSYKAYDDVVEILKQLRVQTWADFEVVIVDNGVGIPQKIEKAWEGLNVTYCKLKRNFGPSLARNIGSLLSRTEVLIFLDDDTIPATDFVERHVDALKDQSVIGVRGRLYGRTPSIYNRFAPHYDRGDTRYTYYIDLGANISVRKSAFISVAGFETRWFGAEEIEFSRRLIELFGDRVWYEPGPVVYHDHASGLLDLLEKEFRHARMRRLLPDEAMQMPSRYKGGNRRRVQASYGLRFRVKLALIARLRGIAKAIGHRWPFDPRRPNYLSEFNG
ncbi:MAG: glycosyltransferase [Dehalococcoidia bacterium]